MSSVGSNNLSLKFQRVTLSGCKGIKNTEFVPMAQFLSRIGKNLIQKPFCFENNITVYATNIYFSKFVKNICFKIFNA